MTCNLSFVTLVSFCHGLEQREHIACMVHRLASWECAQWNTVDTVMCSSSHEFLHCLHNQDAWSLMWSCNRTCTAYDHMTFVQKTYFYLQKVKTPKLTLGIHLWTVDTPRTFHSSMRENLRCIFHLFPFIEMHVFCATLWEMGQSWGAIRPKKICLFALRDRL